LTLTPTLPSQGTLPGLKIDGLTVDKALISFSGTIELNLNNENDRAMLDDLLGGNEVRLEVDAYVTKSGGTFPRDKEGALKETRKGVSLKVHSLNNRTVMVTSTP
jgi:hypothetical protein